MALLLCWLGDPTALDFHADARNYALNWCRWARLEHARPAFDSEELQEMPEQILRVKEGQLATS